MESATRSLETSDSACSRLLKLIVAGQSCVPGNESQLSAWSKILGIPSSQLPLIYQGIGEFCVLVVKARAEIAGIDGHDNNDWLETFDEIERIIPRIQAVENSPIGNVFAPNVLSPATVRGLRLSASVVAKYSPKRIKREDLSELREMIEKLDVAIQKSPNGLRQTLEKCSRSFRLAINHYEIWGVEGIEEAIHQSTGAILFAAKSGHAVKDEPAAKKAWEWIARANAVVSLVKNSTPMLAEATVGLQAFLDSCSK